MRRKHSFEFSWAVGNRIYQLRTARGMSQRELAQALGSDSNEFVARWERGGIRWIEPRNLSKMPYANCI